MKHKIGKVEKYWSKRGPQWVGIAVVKGEKGQKGLLWVEAIAHVHEMSSAIQAKNKSRVLIEQTIDYVKNTLGSDVEVDIWLNQYYQLLNRLAYLPLLNNELNIKT